MNHHSIISIFALILFILLTVFLPLNDVQAQIISKEILEKLKNADRSEFRYIPKKPGHYTIRDWHSAIDSTWGQGMTTAKKLQLFNTFWNLVNHEYPSFFHIQDNWNPTVHDAYYDTINAGISRGRFYGIMSHLASSLTDMHTNITDWPVSTDSLKPGVPLFVPWHIHSFIKRFNTRDNRHHFGASLAPLPDSSAFVYDVIPNHPLGLEPGDVILGYDGIPWKYLYQELIDAELPMVGAGIYGSNSKSALHGLLAAAGENWHLFDTIDILKYSNGDTLHLPTSLLVNQEMILLTTDQLPIQGVSFPDLVNGHSVSWGIVDGTQIGYIYTWSWTINGMLPYPSHNAGDEFLQALQTLVNNYQVEGLIIDSRCNAGGYVPQYIKCLNFLFNEDEKSYRRYKRSDPNNHYSMIPYYIDLFDVEATPYLFDKPIALLTGPYSISCGDFMPLQMRKHPMVRTFGLGSNSAFGHREIKNVSYISPDWEFKLTLSNFSLVQNPDTFLTHLYIQPDEEIWFTQQDAVRHEDSVVKRALQWINHMIYAYNIKPGPSFYQSRQDTLTITANVANPDNHNLHIAAMIHTLDSIWVDSLPMFDDGSHSDSLAGDGLYGVYFNPLLTEDIFTISTSITDLDSTYYHVLPRAVRFTTIGPVILDNYEITSSDTIPHHNNNLKFQFTLRNDGLTTIAKNISSHLVPLDTFSTPATITPLEYGNIAPGSTAVGNRKQYIRFDLGSQDSINVYFKIEIYSDDRMFWSDTFSVFVYKDPTGFKNKEDNIPVEFTLSQNYPNPFNPKTTIEFSIPKTEFITLKVYNILGQEVTTLVSKKLTTGKYKFDWNAENYSSGIYYYRITSESGFDKSRKLLLMK